MTVYAPSSAAAEGLACCHVCFKLAPETRRRCSRCGSALHLRKPHSLQRTLALLLTALILYIPANLLPIMTTEELGRSVDNTILGGVVLLIDMGSYPIAAVIFVASVLVPLGKFFVLAWLCWSVNHGMRESQRQRTVLYRITDYIGRWSMVDVFVVTVLVALIHLGGILRITAGPAAVAFGGVVIMTMFAAESFDPRLIWDLQGDPDA